MIKRGHGIQHILRITNDAHILRITNDAHILRITQNMPLQIFYLLSFSLFSLGVICSIFSASFAI